MALFQRQPIELSQKLPYTVSFTTKTILIVGLGNPGKEYDTTRHNIGFMVLDTFAAANNFSSFRNHPKFNGKITEATLGQTKVILLKPQTFMNESGQSVGALKQFYKLQNSEIFVVHDELSIPFGQIRTRIGGQSAGHNGIKSLIAHIGADFGRIRVGIKNEFTGKKDTSDFVLGTFSKDEQTKLEVLISEVCGILTECAYGGVLSSETRSIETS
jgi:PTH1 family peptidyl-tRNA hydrolase